MKLFQRLVFAAVLAGLAAGLLMSALQQWRVAPLILAAEAYEDAVPAHEHADAAAAHAEAHDAAWAPADGPERIGYTVLANLLAAAGFALLLGAASTLAGLPVTAANGALWGLAGFAAFHLAPALGLPPELPGMPAADLGARQLWWWATAVLTGAAIYGVARFRSWPAVGVGAVLILLPHLVGAPTARTTESAVPAHLATAFAASTLVVAAAFWLTLGPLYGWLWTRLGAAEARAAARPVTA